jgi:hypothetical protein
MKTAEKGIVYHEDGRKLRKITKQALQTLLRTDIGQGINYIMVGHKYFEVTLAYQPDGTYMRTRSDANDNVSTKIVWSFSDERIHLNSCTGYAYFLVDTGLIRRS